MNKKSIVLFVVCLAGLLALQIKFVLPYMNEIAASDLFLVESKDLASPLPISNDMTAIAFSHCNTYIKKDLGEETAVAFANQPTNVWSLGNYEYIVNADAEITPKDAAGSMRHYVCRIQYQNGDDLSGVASIDNWNIEGINGLTDE
ncbi:hypothetical protein [Methylomonas sp. AM2-LC]|uniref:hypothetical protein n=1 Tax=Methylomonas sp. AM2-LC TaxID=3153301 RepID=UPI003262DE33